MTETVDKNLENMHIRATNMKQLKKRLKKPMN